MPKDTKTRRLTEQLQYQSDTEFATKVTGGVAGNFAGLDAAGNITDSGSKAADFVATDAIKADGTQGRVLRLSELTIEDGTAADSAKCTLASVWNGDAIAATDNVAKGATTGNFTLNAGGDELIIETTGITGNTIMAFPAKSYNSAGPMLDCDVRASANDIKIVLRNPTSSAAQDICGHVNNGSIKILILYLTSA
jgi:hypothetical protein